MKSGSLSSFQSAAAPEARVGGGRDDEPEGPAMRGPWPYDVLARFIAATRAMEEAERSLARAKAEFDEAEADALDLFAANKGLRMVAVEADVVRIDHHRGGPGLEVFTPAELPSVFRMEPARPAPAEPEVETF